MNDLEIFSKSFLCCFYNLCFDESFFMEPHSHSAFEISYLLNGNVDLQIFLNDNHDNALTINLKAGQFIIINSNLKHRLCITSKVHILNLELSAPNPTIPYNIFLSDYTPILEYTKVRDFYYNLSTYCILVDDNLITYNLILSIHRELEKDKSDPITSLTLSLLYYQLFIEMSQCKFITSPQPIGNIYTRKVMSYISQHYKEVVSLDTLASVACVTKSYLQKIFKYTYNSTVISMLTNYRIKKAKSLLKNTLLSIIDISKATGFSSVESFRRCFKKYLSYSPQEYRLDVMSKGYHQYNHYPNCNNIFNADI